MSNASPSANASGGWSEVRASDQVIRYRRLGSGPTVLVLCPERLGMSSCPLMEALGAHFRLLVPDLRAAEGDTAARLALFLDGLGVATVAVLAMGELCVAALELAFLGGDQVTRLALVTERRSVLPELDGGLVTAPGRGAVPLVLLRDQGETLNGVPALVRFLGEVAA